MIIKRNPVQGYMFNSVSEEHERRNETVCQIRERVEIGEDVEFGPAFLVEFGDGERMTAYSSELSPWYQTG